MKHASLPGDGCGNWPVVVTGKARYRTRCQWVLDEGKNNYSHILIEPYHFLTRKSCCWKSIVRAFSLTGLIVPLVLLACSHPALGAITLVSSKHEIIMCGVDMRRLDGGWRLPGKWISSPSVFIHPKWLTLPPLLKTGWGWTKYRPSTQTFPNIKLGLQQLLDVR